jgi:DNA polymerase I
LIDAMHTYRTEAQWKSLYAEAFLDKGRSGFLHPSYNQLVRTGRMSCSNPNSQQLNKRAKRLIVPRERFYSTDASQIEFRFIAHYLQDPDVIRAYKEDASTDFHQWVADLCGIPRRPAKTINFATAYGAGKARIASELSQIEEIIERFQCDDPREYERLCNEWALMAYTTYHERLPGIKRIAERAAQLTRQRGWIRNYYHRRRHLPRKAAHMAFNTMIQGGAMDYIKRRMNELDEMGAPMVANVHDELLFDGYVDREVILNVIQARDDLRVPIMWDWNESNESWADVGLVE